MTGGFGVPVTQARGWSPEPVRASSELRFADRFSSLPELYRQGWDGARLVLPAVSCRPPRQGVQRPSGRLLLPLFLSFQLKTFAPHSWRPLPLPLLFSFNGQTFRLILRRLLLLAVSFRPQRQGVLPHSWLPPPAGASFQLPGRDVPPLSSLRSCCRLFSASSARRSASFLAALSS